MKQDTGTPIVRIAELEIDSGQLASYKALLAEEIAVSIDTEPGVLALYAVAIKGIATQIRLFEMYASEEAYQSHLRSAHFLRYKALTSAMVQSLRLVETEPIMLGARAG